MASARLGTSDLADWEMRLLAVDLLAADLGTVGNRRHQGLKMAVVVRRNLLAGSAQRIEVDSYLVVAALVVNQNDWGTARCLVDLTCWLGAWGPGMVVELASEIGLASSAGPFW